MLNYTKIENHLNYTLSNLDFVNPLKKFRQGFSISTVEGDEQSIRSVSKLKVGDTLVTQLEDGLIFSKVNSFKKKKLFKDCP